MVGLLLLLVLLLLWSTPVNEGFGVILLGPSSGLVVSAGVPLLLDSVGERGVIVGESRSILQSLREKRAKGGGDNGEVRARTDQEQALLHL